MGIPILGICYGAQLITYVLDGKVSPAPSNEYGKTEILVDSKECLFKGMEDTEIMWMSHSDHIEIMPEGFHVTAHTTVCPVAAMENPEKKMYGTQFHPEVMHSVKEKELLANFVYGACGCKVIGRWIPLWKLPLTRLDAKSATEKFCAHCPAGSTLRLPQYCFPRPWETADLRVCRSRSAA